ncbi:MAG TPA: hypothetical protein VII06_43105 [Chloroflexota bacterium]|jgi:hypothetical protein
MAVQLETGGHVASRTYPVGVLVGTISQDPRRGTWRGRYRDAHGREVGLRAPTRAAMEARLTALGVQIAATRPHRTFGTGSVRQRSPYLWEGRYNDATGCQRWVSAGTREACERLLAAAMGQARRAADDPVSLEAWAGLKAAKAPRRLPAHVYQETALRQLVRAVEDYLAGEALVDTLDLALAAAHGALGEEAARG